LVDVIDDLEFRAGREGRELEQGSVKIITLRVSWPVGVVDCQ
jgi:hypothetical protein